MRKEKTRDLVWQIYLSDNLRPNQTSIMAALRPYINIENIGQLASIDEPSGKNLKKEKKPP